MRNVVLFFVAFSTFQTLVHAFHKESYYGDPYSMEYVGKFSTVNLTKEDILWVDYVVEMLRNTSYSTIDFNASITYPSRFRHLYETEVPTITTRRFATTSTKSLPEEMWTYPHEFNFGTGDYDLWETPSSISFTCGTADAKNRRLQKKSDSTKYLKTKSIAPLWTTMSEDRLAIVRDIIRRNIIKKPVTKYTEREILHQVTEERKKHSVYHTTISTTTRTRRSVPFFLDSDEGPWLTTKEQEQEWALRGTSLLDSEKYDFPFPYDWDKWPGCTTKDLTDPKNTVQILEYENGHIRFIGVSKPGWNEFPWKPTEFTTAYPAYRRLDKYLTYLSRPWYGFYSTLSPPAPMQWNKRTTQKWSTYTFGNRSWKSRYDATGSKKWIIDRWPPIWNKTIFPPSSQNTRKITGWGGKWHIPIRMSPIKVNSSTSKPYIYFSKSITIILTPYYETSKSTGDLDSSKSITITLTPFPDVSKSSADTKNLIVRPHKPISSTSKSSLAFSKSTPDFGFLSISPTWFTYSGNLTHTFRHNATWVAEWSRLLYSASKTLWKKAQITTSNMSLLEKYNKLFSLPIYTIGKETTQRENWLTLPKTPFTITWSEPFHTKPSQLQPKQWNGGYANANQYNTENQREWRAPAKQNVGGWTRPELKRGSTISPAWGKQFQQFYSNQWGAGGERQNTWNNQIGPSSGGMLYPKSYQQYQNQWNKQNFPVSTVYQNEWNQKRPPGPQQYRGASNTRPKTWPNQNQRNRQQSVTGSKPWYTNPKVYQQFPPTQWGRGGGSNVWNRGVPPSGSKFFFTNQQYPNQGNKDGQPALTRSWNTKPPQFHPNQRNAGQNLYQWNAQKPSELGAWTVPSRRGWPTPWSKSWDQKQSPTRSRTWYPSPSP